MFRILMNVYRIQMDVDSRKNEAKDDLKNIDLQIEVSCFVDPLSALLTIYITNTGSPE